MQSIDEETIDLTIAHIACFCAGAPHHGAAQILHAPSVLCADAVLHNILSDSTAGQNGTVILTPYAIVWPAMT